ncbi:MAG TPA: GMC family oxidoreductase N-terminal domain-containing protein [Ilumatobacter sp.]|nr:GMC family oxidoreductase N-terminal domain-containing protein [Ilumatobacter sp.]
MTRWVVAGGGTAGCVVAANLAAGLPDDEVVLLEASAQLGGASLVNAGVVVGGAAGYRHRLPLEPPGSIGALGRAVLAADPRAAPALLARRAGRRVSVAEAYLASPPANLTVRTGTPVDRVVFDGSRAVGVLTAAGDQVAADRVVLSAGAVTTPALLLRSGVTELPGLGEHLQDHVGVSLAVQLKAGLGNPAGPDVAVTVEHGEHQVVVLDHIADHPGLAGLLAGFMAPLTEGAVTLPDPDGPPHVALDRAASASDTAGLRAAFDLAVALSHSAEVQAIAEAVYVDAHGTTLERLLAGGDSAVALWMAGAPNAYHHVAGSCRIGVVTDDLGRVWMRSRLAVCDASLLPGVPRRNPYLTVIDLAERLSSAWVQGLRRELRGSVPGGR